MQLPNFAGRQRPAGRGTKPADPIYPQLPTTSRAASPVVLVTSQGLRTPRDSSSHNGQTATHTSPFANPRRESASVIPRSVFGPKAYERSRQNRPNSSRSGKLYPFWRFDHRTLTRFSHKFVQASRTLLLLLLQACFFCPTHHPLTSQRGSQPKSQRKGLVQNVLRVLVL